MCEALTVGYSFFLPLNPNCSLSLAIVQRNSNVYKEIPKKLRQMRHIPIRIIFIASINKSIILYYYRQQLEEKLKLKLKLDLKLKLCWKLAATNYCSGSVLHHLNEISCFDFPSSSTTRISIAKKKCYSFRLESMVHQ